MMPARKLALGLAIVSLVACGRRDPLSFGETGEATRITGEGASFPKRLYDEWVQAYKNVDPRTTVSYEAGNSDNGQTKIEAKAVTFGASDYPLDKAEQKGILQIPAALGAVVVSYHLPDNPQLRLSAEVLGKIYAGQILSWDDPAIKALNPQLTATGHIVPLYREGKSGSNGVLTEFLAHAPGSRWAVSHTIEKAKVATTAIGVSGSKMEEQLEAKEGSIGYLDYSTAASGDGRHALKMATLVKDAWSEFDTAGPKSQRDVAPTLESIAAAAAAQTYGANAAISLVNAKGDAAYPMTTITYMLVQRETSKRDDGIALARFLWWATHEGQKLGPPLKYVPLPPELVLETETQLRRMLAAGKSAITET